MHARTNRTALLARLVASAFALALALAPAAALAHPGGHHAGPALGWREVARWWTWDPLVALTLSVASLAYARGLARLWRRAGADGRGVRRWEAGAYAAGVLSLVVALVSPLDRLSDVLFSAHMSQHEILMLVSAPLIVLGRPLIPYLYALPDRPRARAVAWAQRPAVRRAWRGATDPLAVVVLHGAALWAWHAPALFEAALASEAVHAAQHAMFFATAVLFWWALIHGRYGRAGYGVAVLYVFATAMHSGLLGALLAVGTRLWYPTHAARSSARGVDALADQRLAGLIMWVPAGVLLAMVAVALFAAWMGEIERRAERAERTGRRPGAAGRERGEPE